MAAKLGTPEGSQIGIGESSDNQNAETTQTQNNEVVKESAEKTGSTKNESGDGGHAVPYSRFKSVNEEKKFLAKRNAEIERELNELREREKLWKVGDQKEEKSQTKVDDSFSSLFDDDNEPDEKWEQLNRRLQTFEEREASAQLEREIGDVRKQYPKVPEQVLLQAIVNNPKVDIGSVARNYDAWTAEIEQNAIDSWLKSNGGRQQVDVARRPQAAGLHSGPAGGTSPKTMGDAKTQALAALKKSGFFG